AGGGAQLRERARAVQDRRPWLREPRPAGAAGLCRKRHADDRGRHRDLRFFAVLPAARGTGGRWIAGGAGLVQALCHADLARRRTDGTGRAAVAELPAAARRGAATCPCQNGASGMKALLLAVLLAFTAALPA